MRKEKVGRAGEMSVELNGTVDVVMLRAARQDFSGTQVGSLGQGMAWRPALTCISTEIDRLNRPIGSFHLFSISTRGAELYSGCLGVHWEPLLR